jgi:hypothetical protein
MLIRGVRTLQEIQMQGDPRSTTLHGSAADQCEMSPQTAIEAVRAAVASWDGVTTGSHRFGGIEFRVGRRELGHLHGTIADLPFPRRIRDELIATGRARRHHVLPRSGWVTAPMRTSSEVSSVIELFRQNYDRARFREDESEVALSADGDTGQTFRKS